MKTTHLNKEAFEKILKPAAKANDNLRRLMKMSELENCCGTTCDKNDIKAEFASLENIIDKQSEEIHNLKEMRNHVDAQITRVLNERVDIENILANVGAGKMPLLTARDCQVLAIRLGTPKKHWSDAIKNHVWGIYNEF